MSKKPTMSFVLKRNNKNVFTRIMKRLFNYKSYIYFQRNYVFERDLSENTEVPSGIEAEKAELRIIQTPREMGLLISDGFDLGSCPFLAGVKEGLNKGAVLFFLFIGKTLAHSSWVSMDKRAALFDPMFRKIKREDEAGIGPCWTDPFYRGKGFYPRTLYSICEYLSEKGRSKVLISTKKTNHSSKKGIQKAGFVPVAVVLYVKLLLWDFSISRRVYEKDQI
jgi:hypothetical protein